MLPEARELIKKFDETLFNIRDMNAYHRGMVTLACIPTAVFYFYRWQSVNLMSCIPILKCGFWNKARIIAWNRCCVTNQDFGINMNNVTNSSIDFTPLINEPFVLACRRDHPLAKKQLVEWQELVGYKMIGVRSSSGKPIVDRTTASRQALEAGLVLRSASSFDVIRTGRGGTGDFGASWSGNAPCALFFDYWYSTGGNPLYVGHWGLFAAKMPCFLRQQNAFALLINLWTDDKDNLWTNIVERQRHALRGDRLITPAQERLRRLNQRLVCVNHHPILVPARPHNGLFHAVVPARQQFRIPRCGEILPGGNQILAVVTNIEAAQAGFPLAGSLLLLNTLPSSETLKTVIRLAVRSQAYKW